MDGQFDKIEELIYVESHLSNTSAKFYGEITQQMLKNSQFPGSNNGTGLFQTIVGLKIREVGFMHPLLFAICTLLIAVTSVILQRLSLLCMQASFSLYCCRRSVLELKSSSTVGIHCMLDLILGGLCRCTNPLCREKSLPRSRLPSLQALAALAAMHVSCTALNSGFWEWEAYSSLEWRSGVQAHV